jgi:hypothetical protein
VVVLLVGDRHWQLLSPSSLTATTAKGTRFTCGHLTLVLASAAAAIGPPH